MDVEIVVREWVDKVIDQPQGEFRAFVGNNRLNAVSQYYSFCLFPEVVDHQTQLCKALQRLFDERLRACFESHESYIVDLWVDSQIWITSW